MLDRVAHVEDRPCQSAVVDSGHKVVVNVWYFPSQGLASACESTPKFDNVCMNIEHA